MKDVEDRLLVKIAQMYYEEDKNQSQISKELNIHRSTISRLLKKSREEGIVNISINYDLAGTYTIEKELEERFELQKAVVVPTATEITSLQKVHFLGEAANRFLQTILTDDMIIGFSWGQAMAAVSESLQDIEVSNIMCIPLVGGPSGRLVSDYHVNTITYEASKNLKGKALLIDSPAFPKTKELKSALMSDDFNQELAKYWKKISVAVFGVGSPLMKDSDRWQFFYGEDVLAKLNGRVAGDVVSRFYDKQGQHIPNELDDRLIGINIEELKNINYRIAVAESLEKVPAIRGALLGGYANVVVTTQETAEEILKN
ncbi:sugar-binding transcriptional regulator [Tetragenococcus koreensis]|uniref:sugar-binding transcriptional regulator n=1 Tax=Tetragenococcus koreensis TaxID=290335 RepID=UPI001F2C3A3A|nr:sugar-binding transcriptional regulator [Tetragenococcus koreensis]MDN6640450.1 sugar-binding transcriptional regulator [Tetragenococcus sp.]MCF1585984.1 sugar-binding transcriptional regulator [Tetragenococcus koreensis]MCF1615561.1 sugar-binding transcriptional regulator [Tetragenococcus koreensis]MCF1619157.1 sugar-binding transcriptional regulator [Tetragenococcus koreensis]MCF1625358.1 sugar-binding transcriptional regulator [Tetragenococcus koreensis]